MSLVVSLQQLRSQSDQRAQRFRQQAAQMRQQRRRKPLVSRGGIPTRIR